MGRPWGKTAFITGYTRRDLTFSPQVSQFFTTSTYAGLQRKFWTEADGQRAGRVHPLVPRAGHGITATAQALRPGGTMQYNVEPILER